MGITASINWSFRESQRGKGIENTSSNSRTVFIDGDCASADDGCKVKGNVSREWSGDYTITNSEGVVKTVPEENVLSMAYTTSTETTGGFGWRFWIPPLAVLLFFLIKDILWFVNKPRGKANEQ